MLNKLLSPSVLVASCLCVLSTKLIAQDGMLGEAENEFDYAAIEAYFQDWFQVEVIVFERRDQVTSKEQWPKNIFLSYPPNSTHLYSEEAWIEANTPREEDTDRLISEFGAHGEDVNIDSPAAHNQPFDARSAADENELGTALESALASDGSELEALAETVEDWRETPFILLDNDDRLLESELRKLENSARYRVLFHESWRQQIKGNSDAQSIIILGGDQFENHRELEGSIRLSLSRYLHINTQLWFTEFESNYGQESEHWPALPEIPDSYLVAEETVLDGIEQATNVSDNGISFELSDQPEDLYAGFQFDNDFSSDISDVEKESAYLVRKIITLRQQRRMRSGELHYIDHPRLGILLKIEPYSPPILEEKPE
jgi:hypothetical protein